MEVKVRHYYRTGLKTIHGTNEVIEKIAHINIYPDNEDAVPYWSYPVTFFGKSSEISVKVTVIGPYAIKDNVKIETTNERITINSSSYHDVAEAVTDFLR
jgi:hypothetical protein